MSKELVCPFCQQELSYMDTIDGGFEMFSCDCASGIWLFGNDKMWQELISTKKQLEMANAELDYIKEQIEKNSVFNNTRKALDRAKWWLHEIVENHRCTPISTAEMALKEITATLENKNGNR